MGEQRERRVLYETGEDVDFPLIPLSALDRLESSDNAAKLLQRGYRILADEIGLETRLRRIAGSASADEPPGQAGLTELASDFWYHALWTARKLRRGEVFTAIECLDGYMKARLVTLLEWHARAVDPSVDTWHAGRFLERWADPGALAALERAYAHYDLRDVARALWETIDLFQGLEEETARRLGLAIELDHADLRRRIAEVVRDPRRPDLPCGREARSAARRRGRVVARGMRRTTRRARRRPTTAKTTSVRVYFLRDGKVWPVAREVETGSEPSTRFDDTLAKLFEGPTADERQKLGAGTAIPDCAAPGYIVYGGDAGITPSCANSRARSRRSSTRSRELPTVRSVEIGGKRYTRRDFEEQTPSILVESPLPFERGDEPASRHRHREHVRGDVPVRAARRRRERRRQELRDGDLGDGDARHVRLHDRRRSTMSPRSSSSRTPPRTVADQRGRDPADRAS